MSHCNLRPKGLAKAEPSRDIIMRNMQNMTRRLHDIVLYFRGKLFASLKEKNIAFSQVLNFPLHSFPFCSLPLSSQSILDFLYKAALDFLQQWFIHRGQFYINQYTCTIFNNEENIRAMFFPQTSNILFTSYAINFCPLHFYFVPLLFLYAKFFYDTKRDHRF
ncbi:hypothetical protein ABID39_001546 [Bartonella japonica]|uniref:Uncharacterized protein n=1 Tax=Bartonella japonica TaxID=357761 RepID=A0ABV2FQI9_9HYPH